MDTCDHTFVKIHKIYTKSEAYGELWTWGDYDVSNVGNVGALVVTKVRGNSEGV